MLNITFRSTESARPTAQALRLLVGLLLSSMGVPFEDVVLTLVALPLLLLPELVSLVLGHKYPIAQVLPVLALVLLYKPEGLFKQ
mgnify:CR=1 FL=1